MEQTLVFLHPSASSPPPVHITRSPSPTHPTHHTPHVAVPRHCPRCAAYLHRDHDSNAPSHLMVQVPLQVGFVGTGLIGNVTVKQVAAHAPALLASSGLDLRIAGATDSKSMIIAASDGGRGGARTHTTRATQRQSPPDTDCSRAGHLSPAHASVPPCPPETCSTTHAARRMSPDGRTSPDELFSPVTIPTSPPGVPVNGLQCK